MNVDITKVGSGNIGATNAFRVLGKKAGTLVLLVDAAKGAAAVLLVPFLATAITGMDSAWLRPLGALSAVLGHNYTCWLKFKGGKGIATSAGAMAALIPLAFVITLATWLLVFAISRYVSLASIAAAVALPIATGLTAPVDTRWPLVGLTSALGALAIWRHRPNIRRLLDGTENRFGKKKETAK